MLATSTLVRRSVLRVAVTDRAAADGAWRHNADAIALDLSREPELQKAMARGLLAEAVGQAARGGAEVFVQIDRSRAYADIKAAVRPGLTGVIVPGSETASEVQEVDQILRECERAEGLESGALEIFLLIDTASGIWRIRELVHASPRIACVAIDEVRLCHALGIVPDADFDPLSFSRGRVIVETLAAVKLPLGIGHPLGALPREVDEPEVVLVAERARNTGFKGAICEFPTWVAACNAAFTPTDEQVQYYRDMREAFARGVARGTAAVPFPGGRMIDVPVDERAKLVIDWWQRCQRRDAEKAGAVRAALA